MNEQEYLLSVCIPTNKNNAQSYASICQALAAAEQSPLPVEILISDNSGDERKRDALLSIIRHFPCARYIEAPVARNHEYVLGQASAKYCLLMGDDDSLLVSGVHRTVEELRASNHSALVGPMIRMVGDRFDVVNYSLLESPDLHNRVRGYIGGIPSGNLLFHGIYERSLINRAVRFWFSLPNQQAYQDQLMTLLLAANGSWVKGGSSYFIYNMGNWSAPQVIMDSELRHARAMGYPDSIIIIQRLLLALEGFMLLIRTGAPDRMAAASTWFTTWFGLWVEARRNWYIAFPPVRDCPRYSEVLRVINLCDSCATIDIAALFAAVCQYYQALNGTGYEYEKFWRSDTPF